MPPFLPGILITVLIFFFWRSALQAVYLARVEENRLSLRSFRKSRDFTVQQICDIDLVTIRNRRGVAKSVVRIELHDASKLTLFGFPEGSEILYGYLKNWWGSDQHP